MKNMFKNQNFKIAESKQNTYFSVINKGEKYLYFFDVSKDNITMTLNKVSETDLNNLIIQYKPAYIKHDLLKNEHIPILRRKHG